MIAGKEDIMKKVILGILLLAALVAISYVKIYRDRQHLTQSRQEGVAEGQADLAVRVQQVDSLSALVEQNGQEMAESLTARDIQQAALTDSLRTTLDEQCSEIESLKRQVQKTKTQPSKKAAAPARKAADSGSDSTAKAAHKDILSYYTEQVDKLPKDLSDYERRVALREVREETARKFAITAERLDEIRKQYSLDY
jgi:hypothetical protein